MSHLQKVYAYAEMFPTGQKINAAILLYDAPIRQESVDADAYCVEGRRIVGVSVSDQADPAIEKPEGRYVILHLSTEGKTGDVVVEGERKNPGPPPPKTRVIPSVRVRQEKTIRLADGETMGPDGAWADSTDTIEPVVDRFLISEYDGLKYNLFVPKAMNEDEKYPLVLFIADIGANRLYDRMALSQGIGGTIWATDEEQQKHPCFVLVPQFPYMQVMRDDCTFDPIFSKVKPLLDHICETYPVDRDRLYATGQSQGCMAACELNCEYPDLFAGSLLVAGQWDAERMADRCVGQRYWIVVSEADKKASGGMTAILDAMSAKGAKVATFSLDARAAKEEWEALIAQAEKQPADIRMTVFTGDSVIPDWDDGPNRIHHAHSHTWPMAYQLEGIRDWLFTCTNRKG